MSAPILTSEHIPPGSWVQLDQAEAKKLAKLAAKAPVAAAAVTLFMAEMDGDRAIVMSHELMAAILGVSKSSIRRAVDTLKQGQWVQVVQIGSTGTTNAYVVNSSVAWQGPRAGLRTAKFRATVVAFEAEQSHATGNMIERQTDLEDAEFCGKEKAK